MADADKGSGLRRQAARIVAVLVLAIGCGAAACLLAGPTSTQAAAGTCTPAEQAVAFGGDQSAVLQRVGALHTLGSPVDVAALAAKGWSVLPHAWVSFGGMGVAFMTPDTPLGRPPVLGKPGLLLYAPGPGAGDATDPFNAAFPYELIGWAYLSAYDYNRAPTGLAPCYSRSIWFVHERGIHPFSDFRFICVPPQEQFHGQGTGQEPFVPSTPGVPHPRFWDVHFFLNRATGVPSTGIVRPGGPAIPGIDPGIGTAFFFPGNAASGQQVPSPKATLRLRVTPTRAAVGHPTWFTIKVSAAVTGTRQPVAGARILIGKNRRLRTDARGRRRVRIRYTVPGRHRVLADADGYRRGRAAIQVRRAR